MDLGLEKGYKTALAELLMVLRANNERSVGLTQSTWCRWHASLPCSGKLSLEVEKVVKVESRSVLFLECLIVNVHEVLRDWSTDVYPFSELLQGSRGPFGPHLGNNDLRRASINGKE